jgi:hypothetical protein
MCIRMEVRYECVAEDRVMVLTESTLFDVQATTAASTSAFSFAPTPALA